MLKQKERRSKDFKKVKLKNMNGNVANAHNQQMEKVERKIKYDIHLYIPKRYIFHTDKFVF